MHVNDLQAGKHRRYIFQIPMGLMSVLYVRQ